mgnify:CR=1 FL=1
MVSRHKSICSYGLHQHLLEVWQRLHEAVIALTCWIRLGAGNNIHGVGMKRRLWCEEAAANAAWLGGIVQRTAQVVRIGEEVGMGDGRVGFSLVGYWVGVLYRFLLGFNNDSISLVISIN